MVYPYADIHHYTYTKRERMCVCGVWECYMYCSTWVCHTCAGIRDTQHVDYDVGGTSCDVTHRSLNLQVLLAVACKPPGWDCCSISRNMVPEV